MINVKSEIEVCLEKVIPDGYTHKLANKGDESPGKETGDLIVKINLQQHKDFIGKGADLFCESNISLMESLTWS